MEDFNRFYELQPDGSLKLIKEEKVTLPDPVSEKEAELLKIYEELKALKGE